MICQDVVRDTMQKLARGVSLREIRQSIDARYRDRADYLARVRAAAEDLVARRYLLAEDIDTVVGYAADRWDALT